MSVIAQQLRDSIERIHARRALRKARKRLHYSDSALEEASARHALGLAIRRVELTLTRLPEDKTPALLRPQAG